MDFNETGLPLDPLVYKAFTAYSRALKDMPDYAQNELRQLRVAQLLVETGCQDNELIALALVINQPGDVWDTIGQLFSPRVVDLKTELENHSNVYFTSMYSATDPIKLLYMAENAVYLQTEERARERIGYQRKVFEGLRGNTSCPLLEERYQQLMDEYAPSIQEELNADADNLFIVLEFPETINLDDDAGTEPSNKEEYPAFEDTHLVQYSDKIRAAYDIITNDRRTPPGAVEYAVNVAETLCTMSASVNEAAVAAALIDLSLPGLGDADFEKWEDQIGKEATEILYEGSLYSPKYAEEVSRGSESFKQIALVVAATDIARQYSMLEEVIKTAVNSKPALAQTAAELAQICTDMLPALDGKSGAPELEELFARSARELQDFLKENTPSSLPSPKRFPFPPSGPAA